MNPSTLTVHTQFQIGEVDPRIFGGFLEHMGRAVYEGVYQPNSKHADADGCRTDVLGALRRLGYKTAILSGGFTFFGSVLQQRLGIDHLHANTLDVREGVVTGEVLPPIVDGARKAEMLQVIAASEGLSLEQCIAVGDGANDLTMLRLAGLGIAFRAKPLVRSSAKQSISAMGLDGILYLIGIRDRDIGV